MHPHKSLCFVLICVIFIFLLFCFPSFGQFHHHHHHHPNPNKNCNSFNETNRNSMNGPTERKTRRCSKTDPPTPEPSGPPQEVKCFSPSSTNVLVSWRPPPTELQNGILTQYSIQYAATDGEDSAVRQITDIPPESSQYLLENLDKWTEYRVTVTAHTDVGAGPESLPQLIRTVEDGMCYIQKAKLKKKSPSCKSSQPLFNPLITSPPSSSLPSLPASNMTDATWHFAPFWTVQSFFFFFKQTATHFVEAPFWLFFPPLCSISTHGMEFWAAGLQLPVPNCLLVLFLFFTVGNDTRWKIVFCFFWKATFKTIFPLHLIIFNHFPLFHCQNSCGASSLWSTWSPLLAPLFYFGKNIFFIPCF